MRALGVVVDEPGVEIVLAHVDGVVEGLAHLHAEEPVEDGAIEAFDKAVGFRCFHLRSAMLDTVQVEIGLVGVPLCSAEFPALSVSTAFAGRSRLR